MAAWDGALRLFDWWCEDAKTQRRKDAKLGEHCGSKAERAGSISGRRNSTKRGRLGLGPDLRRGGFGVGRARYRGAPAGGRSRPRCVRTRLEHAVHPEEVGTVRVFIRPVPGG